MSASNCPENAIVFPDIVMTSHSVFRDFIKFLQRQSNCPISCASIRRRIAKGKRRARRGVPPTAVGAANAAYPSAGEDSGEARKITTKSVLQIFVVDDTLGLCKKRGASCHSTGHFFKDETNE
jgi:hypothetical protein